MPKTATRLLRPRPDPATAVPPSAEESRLTDASDSAKAAEPEQAIVCRSCQGYVTARDQAMQPGEMGTMTIPSTGETHGIALFKTAQVRLEKLRSFVQKTSDELDAAYCRFCGAELGLRITTAEHLFYVLFLERISGA